MATNVHESIDSRFGLTDFVQVKTKQGSGLVYVPKLNDRIGGELPVEVTNVGDRRPKMWFDWMNPKNYSTLADVPMYKHIKDKTIDHFKISAAGFFDPKALVLDLGAGDGATTEGLLKRDYKGRVVAVDYTLSALRGFQQRAAKWDKDQRERVAIERASAYELPLPKESFDGGVATWFSQYHDEKEQEQIAREARRVLKQSAPFVFNTFVDNVAFRDVLFKPTPIPLIKEMFKDPKAMRVLPHTPILMKFGKEQSEGKMWHPPVDDLLQLWKEAGFSQTRVVSEYRKNGAHPLRWNYNQGQRFAVTVVAR